MDVREYTFKHKASSLAAPAIAHYRSENTVLGSAVITLADF